MKRELKLQMALVVDGGEVIIRTFVDETAVLTVRSAEKEEKAEVGLTSEQADFLRSMLDRVCFEGGDD